jgi:Uma2 family endonuclease
MEGNRLEGNTAFPVKTFPVERFPVERSAAVAAPAFDPHAPFDPLVDLDGLWTPELADRYLPIPGMPPAKYECLDGKLIMSPREGTANMFAVLELGQYMKPSAAKSGYHFYLTVNLRLGVQKWIEPDFAVLRQSGHGRIWIPADDVLIAGECVSPSSKHNDRVKKPAECAKAGIPYFMRVDVDYADARVDVELLRLEDGRYRPQTRGSESESFETDQPFPLSFDPATLLEP